MIIITIIKIRIVVEDFHRGCNQATYSTRIKTPLKLFVTNILFS